MLKLMIVSVFGVAACASATPIAKLPRVDDMREHLQMIGVDRLTAKLQICIDADGSMRDVRLVRSSGVSYFDRALVADVRDWRHHGLSATVCEPLTLTYVP